MDQRLVTALVVVLVLTQRLGIPVADTHVSIALPVAYLIAGILLIRRRLAVSAFRAELYLIAVTACLAAAWLVGFRGGEYSVPSLLLLLSIYLPWILRVAGDQGREVVLRAGRTFVRVMLLVAAVGVLQLVLQLLGLWRYEDYLAESLPPDLVLPLYNTESPLFYGSPVIKANAFVLLEPSFLSQYCALAIIVGLMVRIRAWQLLLLLTGLAAAVSGTGLILLAAGGLLILLRAPHSIRPTYVVTAVVGLTIVLLSPVAPLLLERSDEVSHPSSSGYARFSAPYAESLRGLNEEPLRYAMGEGPGAVDRVLPSARDKIGAAILYGSIPKLAFEYGLIAGGFFLLFLLFSMLDHPPWRVVPGAVVIMTFLLSGGLLQPQTAYLAWLFTGFGSSERASGT